MKKSFLKIVALVMAMLMMAMVFAGCASEEAKKKSEDSTTDEQFAPNTDPNKEEDSRPQAVVRNSLLNFVKDLQARNGIEPLVNAFKKGSLELQSTFDMEEIAQSIGDSSYSGGKAVLSAGGKFFFAENAFFMNDLSFSVNIPSEEIDVAIENTDFYISADYAYLANQEILGGAYGIIRGEMANKFKNSAWVSEIPAEAYELVVALLEAYDTGKLNDAAKDVKEALNRYVTKLGASIEKNGKYVVENKKVTVGGEAIDSRVITVSINEKAVIAIFNDLYAELKNDKELRDLFIEYGDYIVSVIGAAEAGDMAALWDEMLDMLGEAINEAEDSMAPGTLILEVATPDKKSVLRKLTLSFEEEGEVETGIVLDVGKDGIKTSDRISIMLADYEFVYDVITDNTDEYTATFQYTTPEYDGKDSEQKKVHNFLRIENNRKAKTFELTIYDPDTNVSVCVLGGHYAVAGDRTEISLDSISADGKTLNAGFSLILIIDEDDPMAGIRDKKDVINVLDFTEADSQRIAENFEAIFGDLFANAAPAPDEAPEDIFESMPNVNQTVEKPLY